MYTPRGTCIALVLTFSQSWAFTLGPRASRPTTHRSTAACASAVETVPVRWSSPSKKRWSNSAPTTSLPFVTAGGMFTASDMNSLELQFAVARLRMEKDAAAAVAACDAIEAERSAWALQRALSTSRVALQKTRRELASTQATLKHELQLPSWKLCYEALRRDALDLARPLAERLHDFQGVALLSLIVLRVRFKVRVAGPLVKAALRARKSLRAWGDAHGAASLEGSFGWATRLARPLP